MKSLIVAAAIAATLAAAPAHATMTTLFYGGDTSYFYQNYSYALYSEANANTGANYQAYDDFTVPVGQNWTVGGMFAHIGDPGDSASLSANWFIRTGVTTSSLGTLVASGSDVAGTISDSGVGDIINGELTSEKLSIGIAPVVLSGGQTYWFALQPISPTTYHIFTGGTASNLNAVGGPLDNFSYWYIGTQIQAYNSDLSAGLTGTSVALPVPEPASLALAGSGWLMLAALRRRRRHSA